MPQWEALTSDPEILQIVRGYKIDFESEPVQYRVPKEIGFSPAEAAAVDAEVTKFLDKRIIAPSEHEPGEFISNIFLRPKKEPGAFRVILNLRVLNKFVRYEHFKMDGLDKAIKMMRDNCFMASMDLKDAYFSVAIHPDHQKYFKFQWKGELYRFLCMPQGLASAPRVFSKLAKVPYSKLRDQGYQSIGYIDDSYLQGEDFEECSDNAQATWKLFSDLGFSIHPVKSVLTPVQILVFLGFVLNSITMRVSLTPEKGQRIADMCAELLQTVRPTIRHVAQVVGSLVAAFPGVKYGSLFYRQVELDRAIALKANRGNYEAHMQLTQRAKDDLGWWVRNILKANKPVSFGNPQCIITSDASTQGWGAALDSTRAGGRWSEAESLHHINYLELLAAMFALQSFCSDMKETHIRLLMDNMTAVAHINQMGGSHSFHCNEITRTIWLWCMDRNIWLSAAHIPGVCNVEADRESRIFHDSTEWMLNSSIFTKITELLFVPEIDIFASRLNKQVDKYISWRPDAMADSVDAFTTNWNNLVFYAFPPFSMMHRVMQKLWEDKGEGILMIPYWPTQSWFPLVMRSLVAQPVFIPAHKELLHLPYNQETVHPLHDRMNLLACHISAKPSAARRFRQGLETSYQHRGGEQQRNSTRAIWKNGTDTVVNGILIPFMQL